MFVRTTLQTKNAYVLHPKDIRTLWSLLESKVGPAKAKALCADDIEREFRSADELLGYDNFPVQKIRGIEFSARTGDFKSNASVSFSRSVLFGSIAFSAEGPEENIASLKQQISGLIGAVEPWYSWLSRIEFAYVVLCIAIFSIATLALVTGASDKTPKLSLSTAVLVILLTVLVATITTLIVIGLNALRSRFFPISTFVIGAGEGRYRTDENVRWGVIVAFFVGLAVAIIFALVWR